MVKLQIGILTICIILHALILQASAVKTIPMNTFSGKYPNGYQRLGLLSVGSNLKVTINWFNRFGLTAKIYRISNGQHYEATIDAAKKTLVGTYYIFEHIVTIEGEYAVAVVNGYLTKYSIEISVDGSVVVNYSHQMYFFFPTHKITVQNSCKIKMSVGGAFPETNIYIVWNAEDPPNNAYQIRNKQGTYTFSNPGEYYIIIYLSDEYYLNVTYSLVIETFCDNYCVNPAIPDFKPVCSLCGNGILEDVEECDNGNKPGCKNCLVVPGYNCIGNIGGSSLCSKQPTCPDGIVDPGEQCDNGGKSGCSSSCLVDTGFNCSAVIGAPSVCSLCGNGIVEGTEECDNKNGAGCSKDCKVSPGFQCRGTSSVCFRSNPVCGNNIGEVGESCDDGNTVAGDGCGKTCLIEEGYKCIGELGEPSKCLKKSPPACGNSILELGEQCDNGNKPGCLNCMTQPNWQCLNQVGSPSVCLPKVIPHCGNGVYEPAIGEICEDGNTVAGDGCDNICQVEFGWFCADNKNCVNLKNPKLKDYCGNGVLEKGSGEVCDDGNKNNGDGCSESCKVQAGWNCSVDARNRSLCSRRTTAGFCGNGITENDEGCDDGFPLRNGDGCSADCRVEAGWNCLQSRCWKI